jgi:hypothetical protein
LQSGREAGSDVFRSQKLSFPLLGMDVGDLDGDGRPEIVVLSKLKEVIVYQWDQGRLNKQSMSATCAARDSPPTCWSGGETG